jgi:hypothetical protein
MLKEWLFWVFGLGILRLCIGGGCCFGSMWLLERDFWLFVDLWDVVFVWIFEKMAIGGGKGREKAVWVKVAVVKGFLVVWIQHVTKQQIYKSDYYPSSNT